jgi:peroxiredoxin
MSRVGGSKQEVRGMTRRDAEGSHDPYVLPEGLPKPVDDGATGHLPGRQIPDVVLPSSMGDFALALQASERLVLYVYPQTGPPDKPIPEGWNELPGARGCTPQSCGFRDHAAELAVFSASIAGLSCQTLEEQLEFATRTRMPFPIISDERFILAERLSLPTFEFNDKRFYKRLALIAEMGVIVKVFYPVFPPDRNAAEVLAWLRHYRAGGRSTDASSTENQSAPRNDLGASK